MKIYTKDRFKGKDENGRPCKHTQLGWIYTDTPGDKPVEKVPNPQEVNPNSEKDASGKSRFRKRMGFE